VETSYVCTDSTIQHDKSHVEKQFTRYNAHFYNRQFNAQKSPLYKIQ